MKFSNEEKIHLSFQKITTYSRCGLQYYFKYVEKIPAPTPSYVAMGKAFHKSVERYLMEKRERGENPELDLLLSTYSDELSLVFETEDIYLDEEESAKGKARVLEELKNSGIHGLKIYHVERVKKIEPAFIEERFEINLEDIAENLGFRREDYSNIVLVGQIDLIDMDGNIIDHKTRKNPPQKDEARKSQQLTIYAAGYQYIFGELPESVILDNIILSGNSPKVVTLSAKKTEEDVKRLLMRTLRIVDGIRKGVFVPPDHSSWACAYCMYRITGVCREYII